jgi:exopolyphosphatase / guanosine-5'-triphosphate,3'-diphosphate pyrophosphatase
VDLPEIHQGDLMNRFAAIDIGTNTVLLLVADTDGHKVSPLLERQEIPRLGRNVDSSRNLSPESTDRVIQVLIGYRHLITSGFGNIPVVVTATSAVRDASNKIEFINRVYEESGFSVRILTGEEEAVWTFDGAAAPLELPKDKPAMVVDIGGGSTELASGFPGSLHQSVSVDMGSVRFTERFLFGDPPELAGIRSLRQAVLDMVSDTVIDRQPGGSLIGVAGTVTTLAALFRKEKVLKPAALNNDRIRLDELKEIIQVIETLTSQQILLLNEAVLRGREDVILAGLLILEGVMEHFGYQELIVSAGGIRHGAVLRAF